MKKANYVIDDLVEKNIKIGSVLIRATPVMETLTGFMIAGFIIFFRSAYCLWGIRCK